jgi:hypothetical protein
MLDVEVMLECWRNGASELFASRTVLRRGRSTKITLLLGLGRKEIAIATSTNFDGMGWSGMFCGRSALSFFL